MHHKLVLSVLLGICVLHVTAQNPKVIRKGMPPITEVSTPKNKAFYNFGQLSGKWQEVKRTTIKSKQPVEFSDTLLMNFYDSNKVEIKDATSMRMTMKGDAYIDPPYNLNAAGDEYIIRAVDKDRLLLDDGDYLKEMNRKNMFYYETLGKLTVPTEVLTTPINVDPKNLEGRWLVYRRQAMAGSVDTDAVVIKTLDIYPSNTIGSAQGQVVCYKSDITESFPCKIVYGSANILVITDSYVWEFNTYKADGKEFVFGEAGRLLYYAKR
ncbi:MAG: hypothetical protein QM737_10635 [Ferruginibacter sp.]